MNTNNILISIDDDLKKRSQQKAKSLGLSLSSLVRMLLIKEINNV